MVWSRPRALVMIASVLTLAACTAAISGHPHVGLAVRTAPSSQRPDFPSVSPSQVAATSAPTTPAPPHGCPTTADYCARFTGSADGWPLVSESDYAGGYSEYNGGTYRVSEHKNYATSEDAPVDLAHISPSGSVQIDVDMVAAKLPRYGQAGVTCWEHPARTANDGTSAFLLQVGRTNVAIGLWDDETAKYHDLAYETVPKSMIPMSKTVRLTARCIRTRTSSGPSAQLSLAVDGKTLVSTTYPSRGKHFPWSSRGKAGVLAAGAKASVYYDNFAVTAK